MKPENIEPYPRARNLPVITSCRGFATVKENNLNKTIGLYGSLINVMAVIAFALCMVFGTNFGSYLSSIFIALGFIGMISALSAYASEKRRAAALGALVFAGMYAVIILLVYFAQLTAVRLNALSVQAKEILDYQNFNLMFDYDLLGYGLMALATFMVSFAIEPLSMADKWLVALLRVHGVFAISCFAMPILGLFQKSTSGSDWIGVAILEFWCLYFIPIGLLSLIHFWRKER